MSEITVSESFTEYINHCQAKSLKQVTIEGYKEKLSVFYQVVGF